MNDTPTLDAPGATPGVTMPEPQLAELQTMLGEIRGGWSAVSQLPAEVKALKDDADKLSCDLRDVRRGMLSRTGTRNPRARGQVSDDCARHLAAQFIVHCQRSD